MAKFVYRMQNILDIKEKLESQARIEFGLKNRAYQEQQQILQEYVVRRVGYERHLKETMQGKIDLGEVTRARSDLNGMKTLVRRQMMEVHKAEKDLEEARKALNEVRKERKIQEKLREKAFDEFKHELAASETKEIDELVSFTYKRNEE
jgi:flagellar FliJ protein